MSTIDPVLIPKPPNHIAFIDFWFAHLPAGIFAAHGLETFGMGLEAVWSRSYSILGEVTLTAVLRRVFYSVGEIYPWLGGATVGPHGIDLSAMAVAAVPQDELRAGVRQCLIDILVVLGKLTSEILSQHIYAGLLVILDGEGATTGSPQSPAKDRKAQVKRKIGDD